MTSQEILAALKTYVALWEDDRRFYRGREEEWDKGKVSGLNRCINSIKSLIEKVEEE